MKLICLEIIADARRHPFSGVLNDDSDSEAPRYRTWFTSKHSASREIVRLRKKHGERIISHKIGAVIFDVSCIGLCAFLNRLEIWNTPWNTPFEPVAAREKSADDTLPVLPRSAKTAEGE